MRTAEPGSIMLSGMRRSSMVWRLFFAHGLLIVLSLGLLGVALSTWAERRELRRIEQQLRSKAVLLQEVVRGRKVEQIEKRLQALGREFDVRITLIAPSGRVLLESDHDDVSGMDNHGDRPEVQAAMESRFGTSTRRSTTLLTSSEYCRPLPGCPSARDASVTPNIGRMPANRSRCSAGSAFGGRLR